MRNPNPTGPTFVAGLAALILIVGACSPEAPSSPPPGSVAPTSTPAPQAEADSASKIDDAERAGAIDHDTALLYKLYASLDYGSLPAEYQSSNPAAGEATGTLAELSGRLEQLPAELRAKVNPFFLRPTDPESVWQKRSATAGAPGSIQLAAVSVIQYQYVDATDTSVRVWYPGALGQSKVELAQELADEIDNSAMWDLEKRAMLGHEPCSDEGTPNNGGDGRLDVYLVWPGVGLDWSGRTAALDSTDYGKTVPGVAVPQAAGAAGCPATSYVIVDGSRDFDHLKSSTAHELFHAFQYSFKNAALGDRDWWAEASATWAMDLVYPNLNHEQVYPDGYWSMASGFEEGPLDNTAGMSEYGAYLWPFYLVQKSGDTSGMAVGSLWQATETTSPIKAMSELSGWSDRFKEFALWNWNKDGAVKYIDSGAQIPEAKLSQATVCMDSQGVGNDCFLNEGTTAISVGQGPTTVQYYEGVPHQPGIEMVRFDLTGLKGKPGAGIQAILSIGGGQIKVEDWSDKSERKFCIKSEDLTRAIVIVSNSSVASGQTLDGEIKVEASAEGCTGWSGTITYTETISRTLTITNQDAEASYSQVENENSSGQVNITVSASDLEASSGSAAEEEQRFTWKAPAEVSYSRTKDRNDHSMDTNAGSSSDLVIKESEQGAGSPSTQVTLSIFRDGTYAVSFEVPTIETSWVTTTTRHDECGTRVFCCQDNLKACDTSENGTIVGGWRPFKPTEARGRLEPGVQDVTGNNNESEPWVDGTITWTLSWNLTQGGPSASP